MRILFTNLLFLFGISHLFGQNNLKVSFINSEPDSIKLVYYTNYYSQSAKEEKIVGRKTDYSFNTAKIYPQVSSLFYNNDTLFVWMENKPLEVSISKNYLSSAIQFNNPNAEFIHSFLKRFPSLSNFQIIQNKILSGSIDQLEMFLFDEKKKQENFLEENKSKLSENVYQYLRKKILFSYWSSIYAYPIIRGNANTKELTVIALPSVILEGFPNEELKNQDYLSIPEFTRLLKYYVTYEASASNDFKKFTDFSVSLNRKLTVSRQVLKGEVHAYNYGQFLLEMYPYISKPEQKQLLKNFSETPLAADYYKFCNEFIKNNPQVAAEKPVAANPGDEAILFDGLDGKKHSLSEFKGKVVYIDFWASWCGPCRAMFPYSKELYKSLSDKEKKEIVFLFISIDADAQTWKKAILDNSLEGVQWHSPGNWSSEAVRYFKINSIPRYMIVNKKGEFVDFNAKRPADPALLEQLRGLIKE